MPVEITISHNNQVATHFITIKNFIAIKITHPIETNHILDKYIHQSILAIN